MTNIIILIHGIQTRPKYNWTRIFKREVEKHDPRFKNWIVEQANYGFLRAILLAIPIVRHYFVWWFKRYLRRLRKKYPEANINIVAHSFGTYISYEAIRHMDIKVNKVVLIGGIVSAHENFKETIGKGKIKVVHNFCSYDDRVARLNPFGHSGYWGFLPPGKREHIQRPWINVYNHRFEITHSEYFDDTPPDFYRIWRDLLIQE